MLAGKNEKLNVMPTWVETKFALIICAILCARDSRVPWYRTTSNCCLVCTVPLAGHRR